MSIEDCLKRAVEGKELDPVKAEEAAIDYNQLVARYEQLGMRRHQAEASAAADLKEATRKAARSRFHAAINQLMVMRQIKQAIDKAPDPASVLKALVDFSELSEYDGFNVKFLMEALNQQTAANLAQLLEHHHLNVVGNVTERASFENLIDELHGDSTGDATAAQLAKIVGKEQDRLRRQANSLGMDIGELANYGVAHAHDPVAVYKAGFETWAAEIEKLGAWNRIIDKSTGRAFATEAGVVPPRAATDSFLRAMYRNITTHGWADREASLRAGGRSLYNRRADHREFHFANGAAWRAYNRQFGTSDPFSALLNGLHGLNRDIALMKVLGPAPTAGLEYAAQLATIRAAKAGDMALQKRVASAANRARDMLRHMDGSVNVVGDQFAASVARGTRQYLAASHLGSAILSAPSDLVTVTTGALIMQLKPNNIMARAVKLAASEGDRAIAAQAGFVADVLTDAGGGGGRFMGQLIGTGITERMSNFTMRATGLSYWTDMLKLAVRMEFGAELARNAHLPFDQMNDGIRQIFERRGVSARDWDRLRHPDARFRDVRTGAEFITPHTWRARQRHVSADEADELMLKLSVAVEEKLSVLIPSQSLEATSVVQMGTSAGTLPGEVMRGATQFRGYTLSLFVGQYRQFLAWRAPPQKKWGLAAATFAGLWLMGGLSIQNKEIGKGNDPRPMTDWKFWKAALFQGGGLGIFGDFVSATESRAGTGLAGTIMGPQVSLINDLVGLVSHGDGNLGRDVSRLIRKDMPFVSSAPIVRAAWDRMVSDNIQAFLDPEAEADFQRQVRRMKKEYGTQPYVARQGKSLRLPDLSNIAGGTR